jgi:hypothetical protein
LLRDCCGVDSVSDDAGFIAADDGRLAAGRLVDLRAVGRDFGAADRGRDVVDLGLAVVARAEPDRLAADRAVEPAAARRVPADPVARDDELRVDEPRDDVPRVELRDVELRDEGRVDDVLDDGRVDVARRLVDGLRALVVRLVVRPVVVAGAALADDIVLAAAVSAFAAVIMALVAVFIDLIADDIV